MELVGGTVRTGDTMNCPGSIQHICCWKAVNMCDVCHWSIAQEQNTTLQPPSSKSTFERKLQLQSMKSDCNLSSRLYMACRATYRNVDQFFGHDNHACSPSLSLGGKLRLRSKADILPWLEVETAAMLHQNHPLWLMQHFWTALLWCRC